MADDEAGLVGNLYATIRERDERIQQLKDTIDTLNRCHEHDLARAKKDSKP